MRILLLGIFLSLSTGFVGAQIIFHSSSDKENKENDTIVSQEVDSMNVLLKEVYKESSMQEAEQASGGSSTLSVGESKVDIKIEDASSSKESQAEEKTNVFLTDHHTSTDNATQLSVSNNKEVPTNAEPGKCYARCWIPEVYDYVFEQVVDKPRTIKTMKLPPLYKTVYDTVVVRPEMIVKEKVPAKYEDVYEQMMIAPASTKWIKGKVDEGCLSPNPEDCQVMCLVEVPAQYTTVKKTLLVHEAFERDIVVPAEKEVITRQVLIQEERIIEFEIPATYKKVQNRRMVREGGYQEWREILCGADLTSTRITTIQQRLSEAGYDPGPQDGMLGSQTKNALKQYQEDHGLPVGNLNMETMRALGVVR